ncbi:N-acetylmuramoyl-L-alanine amidase [Modestobacter roseus]|uniref:Uncharacterized protein with LGFP repeats n=1 Tax=Modestobacter roseus TaxID=1181884 RepID=A0A562IT37_9ACTN|nr:N-acetylmuramoyl-L-alanine amidase [Modestobacter roseus]MQA33272.1 hypothetical protein [Modestobacter roseus]TWH74197.1 uncharacterized protein with LGFP repeats [Modestobacter roseus]
MRRLVTGLTAFLGMTGTILVLPVYAAPVPEPEPVTGSTETVVMGSVEEPAPAAEVQEGTTDPVPGVEETDRALRVTRTDVEPFSLVGVTWDLDPGVTDTVVQVRVVDEGGTWGAWTEVTPEAAEQGTASSRGQELRGGTQPLWTGPSTAVDVELVTRSGAQPTGVALDLVDPGESPADSSLGAPDITDQAHAAATMPAVYSRAQWGADESIRTWDPQYASTIKAATLHHTADSNNYTVDQVPAIMRSIYQYHTKSLGWGDIGYNVIVDKYGRLFEGRAGGLASTVIAAHAGGFNTSTFGVSMLGNYDAVPVPQATVDAVAAVIAWKFSLFGVDPRGSTVLTSGGGGTSRYPAGTKVTLPTIFGHRDVGATACPGRYGYARLGEIRDRVSAQLGSSAPLVQRRYDSDAAARKLLGAPATPVTVIPGGAFAHYANGSIYASPATGARVVRGVLRDKWAALGWENSSLGWPTTDTSATPDGTGLYQHFQGGSLYWSEATGAHVVAAAVRDKWSTTGWENGYLGYPVTDQTAILGGGGAYVHFQGGSIYWSPATGARVLGGVVYDRWAASGWENGRLGLPIADLAVAPDRVGLFAHFQHGSVYWTPSTGARVLDKAVYGAWAATGWEAGPLGYPVTDVTRTPDGQADYAHFQRGSVYASASTGARALTGDVLAAWAAQGWEAGALGLPVSGSGRTPDGKAIYQHFQGGSIYSTTATGTRVLPTAIRDGWAASGWEVGPLGYPVGDAVRSPDGRAMTVAFQGGVVHASATTGGHAVPAALMIAHEAAGGVAGALGLPVSGAGRTPDGKATYQHFQGGSIYATAATGTHVIPAAAFGAWAASGFERGPLGYPTSGPVATTVTVAGTAATGPTTGTVQSFQGGALYTVGGATTIVAGPVQAAVAGAGGTARFGFPTSAQLTTPDGQARYQHFAGGSVYATQAVVSALPTAVRDSWARTGWERGPLGLPVTTVQSTPGGLGEYVHFAGGSVYYSRPTGAHTLRGPIRDAWAAAGWEQGALGFPTTDHTVTPDGRGAYSYFQGGAVYWSASTGAHVLRGAVLDAWARTGWEQGRLGYPTSATRQVADGTRTDFQGGYISVSTATGQAVVTVR